ncbi:hypothetical protein K435DRAFT_188748 [Dendrothele bispora CBS 962.96]|uniref:CDR ABC transporter domain-containing protein n=1 Tax=Dendrothele bispora (strain CBS 962.96) TaxID=1314807 RepID=A0A4S8LVM4_DENBC|nr:hypothetical protein K435DRAFT_188748 [Dendrothele bispora CBS 962.96]
MMDVIFSLYYIMIGQAVVSMSSNDFSFVIAFNGVVQSFRRLGWWKWIYCVSPYTYLIEVLGQAIGHQDIRCSDLEIITLNLPSCQTCSTYTDRYIPSFGGYLADLDATSSCQFRLTNSTDTYSSSFNIFDSHHWTNFRLVCVFTGSIFLRSLCPYTLV